MPSPEFTLAVNTGPLFAAAHAAKKAQAQCLKMTGTIYANALRTLTPPHGNGATLKETANKKNKGITKLRERIAEDIMGGPSPTFARPVRRVDGSWMAFDSSGHYTEGKGNFGLVVPTVKKFGKAAVPMEDPARVIAGGYFRPRKGSMRRIRRLHDGPHFVTASALKALVKRKQQNAGFSISGWAPGARFFAVGAKIARGFYEERGGHGAAGADENLDAAFDEGRIADDRSLVTSGPCKGWISNDSFHSKAQLARVSDSAVLSLARNALRKMEQNILNSYKKTARSLLS